MTTQSKTDAVARAILRTLESPNECDSNMEPANIVDVLAKLARAVWCFHQAPPVFEPDYRSDSAGYVYMIGLRGGHTLIAKKVRVDGKWVSLSDVFALGFGATADEPDKTKPMHFDSMDVATGEIVWASRNRAED
jgi:hypothetical protein